MCFSMYPFSKSANMTPKRLHSWGSSPPPYPYPYVTFSAFSDVTENNLYSQWIYFYIVLSHVCLFGGCQFASS